MAAFALQLGWMASHLHAETPASAGGGLYWFIPDGLRADPEVFDVFRWAKDGELPNLRSMMEAGAYGYSVPTFPSHTPTNFATLLTGSYPRTHGVADGPMRVEGRPLKAVSISGFSSAAKTAEPIWSTLESRFGDGVVLLSVPGSTPPELAGGITIRGRWSGWGPDFLATNFESSGGGAAGQTGDEARLFYFGPRLTEQVATELVGRAPVESFSPAVRSEILKYGTSLYAYAFDSTDNGVTDYDRMAFSFDQESVFADLGRGQWSSWVPVILTWRPEGREVPIRSALRIKVLDLRRDGGFRIRVLYDNVTKYSVKPASIARELVRQVGPMVDFADNFPPQLIHRPEDKATFLEEAEMSFDWHRRATGFLLDTYRPAVMISDVYTPNQMLTSRWWMGYLDPASSRYSQVSGDVRERLRDEVKAMYRRVDEILGEFLKRRKDDTYVVFSSDHGVVPLDRKVRLNAFFREKGWLKLDDAPGSEAAGIAWQSTRAVFLNMAHVFVSPGGLGGNWQRASGSDYEKLRNKVRRALLNLKDEKTGIRPIVAVHKWEDVGERLALPPHRVGDLVLVTRAGYGLSESLAPDGGVFADALEAGHKQAVLASAEPGMWTPFVIVGPGVRKGFRIPEPIRHVDQHPTILKLLGIEAGESVEGRVLDELLD